MESETQASAAPAQWLMRLVATAMAGRLASQDQLAMPAVQSLMSEITTRRAGPPPEGGPTGRAIAIIEERFCEPIGLEELARLAGVSVSKLSHDFKAATGQSPYAHLIDRRIAHAVSLLEDSGLSICQIAHSSGFADQQHMTRTFRKRLARTPKSFRQP